MPDSSTKDLLKSESAALTSYSDVRMSLLVYLSYRILLASTLLILFYTRIDNSILGRNNPELFALVNFIFLGIITAGGILIFNSDDRPVKNHVFLMVFVDIVALTLLMHTSGGISSGFGLLMLVSIAIGSLILQGTPAILLAAIATLAILSEQIFIELYGSGNTAYTQAGLHGIGFFTLAFLSASLSEKLRRSQALASQRKVDLENLEELNSYIIQHMQIGILVVDETHIIRMMNDAAWYLLGMPDAKSGTPLEQASYELDEQLTGWKPLKHNQAETFVSKPGGRQLSAMIEGLENAGTVIFLEDAATLTQHAQQLKLASLGRLTASIAHEIRNPLGAISHAEQLLSESPDLKTADQRLISIINTNTGRLNEVIESILQLTRRDRSQPEEILLHPWLEQFVIDFLGIHNIGKQQVILEIDPEGTDVIADRTQLRQILTNLCENCICHFDRPLKELQIQISGGIARDAGGRFLDIIDNGPGIPEEVARQMFEPFFTTRNAGTGLGLYITKELCESNSITIDYRTLPNGSSRFRLIFPIGI